MAHSGDACLFSVKTHFRSLEFKGLPPGVFDDATKKEQATTSLKTNSTNINHVEYKQGFKKVSLFLPQAKFTTSLPEGPSRPKSNNTFASLSSD